MCKEGIRIGRHTQTRRILCSVGVTSAKVITANPDRIALLFHSGLTETATFAPEGFGAAVLREGLTLYPGQRMEVLTIEQHGQLVTAGYNAIGSGAVTIAAWEVIWERGMGVDPDGTPS